MIDYKAIVRAITDPENQPHQWGEEALEVMFISAVDEIEKLRWENANMEKLWGKSEGTWMEIRDKQDAEIERLREALQSIKKIPNSEAAYGITQTFVDDALKEKE